jgi:hypothetical protein
MTPTAAFRFATDTATLAVFDPARLHHRLADGADWWSIPTDELAEINRGNMLSVSTGSDGWYETEVFVGSVSDDPYHIEAFVACESGQIFVGPGEVIPSDGLSTTDEFGGHFLDITPGTYRVRVSRPGLWSLRVSLQPSDSPAENHFHASPRLNKVA